MQLSVIIPTYNRAARVVNLLRTLEAQTVSDFEVVVVNDGSTDNTAETLASTDFRLNLRVITQANGGRAVAKNTGAQAAIGDLLVFLDDDTRPQSNCLAQHLVHHRRFPGSIAVGATGEEERTDAQRFKLYLNQQWEKVLPAEGVPMANTRLFLAAANCSVAAATFHHLSGFDARLRDAEDFALAVQAYRAGVPIYYHPKAFAWHDDPITFTSYVRRQREYVRAGQILRQLRPDWVSEGFLSPTVAPDASGFKRLGFWLASRPWLARAIDRYDGLPVWPAALRYKLYDIILTGLSRHYPHLPVA